MSLQAMSWAREIMPSLPKQVAAHPRLALMLMADYANEAGESWPSIRRITNEMGCSRSTVQRALATLEEHKLIEVVHRMTKDGRQTSNVYRLTMRRDVMTPASSDPEAPAVPAAAPAVAPAPEEHPIFANAAQQDDRGQPAHGTTGARQYAMTLDWEPEADHWQSETLRRGDPSLAWDQAELADFTAHFSDQPGRTCSSHAWCARFVRWVSENRKRQAQRQARTDQNNANNNARNAGGSTHASHRQSGPIRNSNVSAAEGRAYLEQQRRQAQAGDAPSGDIIDGEWIS